MSKTISKSSRKNKENKTSTSRKYSATEVLTQAAAGWEHLESRQMMSVVPLTGAALFEYNKAHAAPTVEFPFVQASVGTPHATPALATVVNSNWQNNALPAQTTAFELTFDATPSQLNSDSVIGLSNGNATSWNSLAAIVRFNSNNVIDARNGNHYQADTTVNYSAGTNYHFRLEIDPTSHTYSVFVTPQGGSEIQLASNYGFRTQQATTSTLNNLSGYSTVGSASVSNVNVNQVGQAINAVWVNSPIATQTGGFTASFDATPGQAGTDSVFGLSNGNAGAYSNLAAIVRFNTNGTIDARNGGSYQADTTVNYVAGTSYHFRMVIDTSDDSYSVFVTPAGGSEVEIASNYSFRTEQASATTLTNVAAYSRVGSATMNNLTITSTPVATVAPSTPTITTSAASSSEIDVNWSLVGNATSYIIQRSTDGVTFTTIATADKSTNSYSDTGLSASTQYFYTVSAANNGGQSNWSNVSSQTTQAVSSGSTGGTTSGSSSGSTTSTGEQPDANNTGPTNRSIITPYTGPMTITVPGTIIENAAISGQLNIEAHGVELVNCLIDGGSGVQSSLSGTGGTGYGVQVVTPHGTASDPNGPSVSLSYCELTNCGGGCIFGSNWSADHCYIHDTGSDATDGAWNISLTNSYITRIGAINGAHSDGFQAVNGQNIVIEGNNFDIPSHSVVNGVTCKVNSCIFLQPPGSNVIANVTIENNWLSGGNYAIYAAGPQVSGVTVTGNQFGPININTGEQFGYAYQGISSITGTWADNVDANGNAV